MIFKDVPTINLFGQFNRSMLDNFMSKYQDLMSDPGKVPEAICLHINSPGGNVDVLQSILAVMYSSETHFITVSSGLAASCAFCLLMAGDERYVFPGTMLLSHQYSWGVTGKQHELVAGVRGFDLMTEFMFNHYKLHTGLSDKVIKDRLLGPSDIWLSVEEAKQLNIVDDIVMQFTKPVGAKAKQAHKQECRKEAIKRLKAELVRIEQE